jgi:hypothetical protein
MSPDRPMSFWVAVLAVALLGLFGPLAHICPAYPRWLASSPDDPDLDDAVDQLLVDAGMLDTVPTLAAPRGSRTLRFDDGGTATSVDPRFASATRAPPALLVASL